MRKKRTNLSILRLTRIVHASPDDGSAMIFVLAWSVVLVLLTLVVTQVAVQQIAPSDRSERSYAALAAAEAGIQDYLVRIQQPGYEQELDADNPAFFGFVDVAGGESAGTYTYSVDTSRAGPGGEIHIYSTGKSGDVTHMVEAVLSKRSTLDYVYLSDIETPSPDVPGAYSLGSSSGGASGLTSRALANELCSRHWYESGEVDPTGGIGNQRNLNFCQWAGIYSSERITGKIHTNDVWRLQTSDLSNSIDAGAISSSCRSEEEGLAPGEVGCPADHRYLTTSESLYSNAINNARWRDSTGFQGDSFGPTGGDVTNRNPHYESILELPSATAASALMKEKASTQGCIFTGPTRLRFVVEGGVGVIKVTSPDTKESGASCGGVLEDSSQPHTTGTVTISDFDDLVIYVQDLPAAGVDDPNNDYDLNNVWPAGTVPTCQPKISSPSPSNNIYPFVVPSDPSESAGFNSSTKPQGFPSYYADVSNPWYGESCTKGDIYAQGDVMGRVSIVAENNVILTSSLKDSTASTTPGATYGQPDSGSQSVLGIISSRFTYIYRPFQLTGDARYRSSYTWVPDWRESNAQDPIFNAAILAVEACFGSQDTTYGSRSGYIYLWGSLSQKYRCVVGYYGGYSKRYSYDERLGSLVPPYMASLFGEPWKVKRFAQVNIISQSPGVSVYSLLDDYAPEAQLLDATVVFGNATVSSVAGEMSVTAPDPGQVVVRYTVSSGGTEEIRRLVISVE